MNGENKNHNQDKTRLRLSVSRAGLIIAAAGCLAYANTLDGQFIYDDLPSILTNPSIKNLWSWEVFRPPDLAAVAGRPVINFTLALNFALSGTMVWSYHVFNLLVHVLAALTLFGIIRRSLSSGGPGRRYGRVSTWLALASALIWMLHPLQTEAVTYVIQRCESVMGLMFLLTLYLAIRGWQADRPRPWHAGAVLAFLIGVGTKEVIAAAPVMVLLYDLVFVHRGPKEALRRSWGLYAGLLAGLGLLTWLVAGGSRISEVTDLAVPWPRYALTQTQVIFHYLRLALWPDSLCLDYRWPVASAKEALPFTLGLLALLAGTAWGLWKRRPAGYPAAWFFVVLAPTSSVMPILDLAFEHRMYLPLAGLAVLTVMGGYEAGLRLAKPSGSLERQTRMALIGLGLLTAVSLVLGSLTVIRNQDYQNDLTIWTDTVRKRPENPRAHYNVGLALGKRDRLPEAIGHFKESVRLEPDKHKTHFALGLSLARMGRLEEALVYFRETLRLRPDYAHAHAILGVTLVRLGRRQEAGPYFREALRLDPDENLARKFLEKR